MICGSRSAYSAEPQAGASAAAAWATAFTRKRKRADGDTRGEARKNSCTILPRVMALNIKDPAADRLVRELAEQTGESITTAVTVAVRERLERLRGAVPRERREQELTRIAQRSARRRVLDRRSAEEILGYDDHGLPA